jgi:ubiquitin-like-conjugating enzyme ATG3
MTRGVPCLRRATSLAYTDADEDAERLLNFGDSSGTGNEADEWVETHAGRKPTHGDSAANAGVIADIPDVGDEDGDDGVGGAAHGLGGLSLGGGAHGAGQDSERVPDESEIPDIDDIPDIEEEGLEEDEDEAVAAAPVKSAPSKSGVTDNTCVDLVSYPSLSSRRD